MIRMFLILVVSCFTIAMTEGQATAQANPPGNAPLPPNFIPGYSPLVPSINTFPSWSPQSNMPVAPRYRRQTVNSYPIIVGSSPTIVAAPTMGIQSSSMPVLVTTEPAYPVRPLRRLFGRR